MQGTGVGVSSGGRGWRSESCFGCGPGSHPGPRGHREQSHLPFRAYTSPSAGWGDTTYLTGCCEDSEGQCPGFGPEAGARGCRPGRQTVAAAPRPVAFPFVVVPKRVTGLPAVPGRPRALLLGTGRGAVRAGTQSGGTRGPSGQDTSGTGILREPGYEVQALGCAQELPHLLPHGNCPGVLCRRPCPGLGRRAAAHRLC